MQNPENPELNGPQLESLEDVARTVRQCTDCPLYRGRNNAVPGEGNPEAEVMFIGEGPGSREDREGRPFVGPAGQLLEGLLASMGTNRDEVFIANMVKCRPPDNRDPSPDEIGACGKYLDRQIELVNPKVIVTLGRFALGRFFPGESITRASGKARQKDGRTIFPVIHPAAALRRNELRQTLIQDFRTLSQVLAETDRPVPAASGGEATPPQAAGVGPDQFGLPNGPVNGEPTAAVVGTIGTRTEESAQPEQLTLF
jgi:DNA polymerase